MIAAVIRGIFQATSLAEARARLVEVVDKLVTTGASSLRAFAIRNDKLKRQATQDPGLDPTGPVSDRTGPSCTGIVGTANSSSTVVRGQGPTRLAPTRRGTAAGLVPTPTARTPTTALPGPVRPTPPTALASPADCRERRGDVWSNPLNGPVRRRGCRWRPLRPLLWRWPSPSPAWPARMKPPHPPNTRAPSCCRQRIQPGPASHPGRRESFRRHSYRLHLGRTCLDRRGSCLLHTGWPRTARPWTPFQMEQRSSGLARSRSPIQRCRCGCGWRRLRTRSELRCTSSTAGSTP
jgi:hypothetical protein